MLLLALAPIIVLLSLIFVLRWPLAKAAFGAFFIAALIALGFWAVPISFFGSAVLKGALLTFEMVLIIFGSLFFLNFLSSTGLLQNLEWRLSQFTPDRRLQAILLAWLFGSFIEGVSGFGAPPAIVGPLLVGIGFSPLTAITLSLLSNSASVAFGAVGTPIRIGFAGLEVTGVGTQAAFVNLCVGWLVPLMMLFFVVRDGTDGPKGRFRSFVESAPWVLFAGFAFLVPYYLMSYLGTEFPTIVGGAVGLVLAILSLRWRFLLPRVRIESSEERDRPSLIAVTRAFLPYFILVVCLFAGKTLFSPFSARLPLGGGLSHTLQLFNPGFAFLTTVLVYSVVRKIEFKRLLFIAKTTASPLWRPSLSIFAISSLTYVMIVTSGVDPSRKGMIELIGHSVLSPALPYYASLLGAFGAFMAGSATVSNLLFGTILSDAAQELALPTSRILAMQLVGAGVGNMIALPNILAVQAAVKVSGQEPTILRRLIVPCLLYLLATSLVILFL